MSNIFIVAGFMVVFYISALGWGRLAVRGLYSQPTRSITYEAILGLAVLVVIGGFLTIFKIADAFALKILIVSGLIFSGYAVAEFFKKNDPNAISSIKSKLFSEKAQTGFFLGDLLPVFLVMATAVFCMTALLPAEAFNHHDDFFKYLPRLFRLLQTGELWGGPFDYLGFDGFGSHAFLQAFFMLPVSFLHVNAFDAIFCFLLGGLLVNDIGRRLDLSWIYRSCVMWVYIIINPLSPNISSVYSCSMMVLALIYSCLLFNDSGFKGTRKNLLLTALPISLFITSLLSLKNTFVPFAVSYFLIFFLLQWLLHAEKKKVLFASAGSALAVGVMLAPWIWGAAYKINMLLARVDKQATKAVSSFNQPEAGDSIIKSFFSSVTLSYNVNMLEYTFLIFCILIAVLSAIYLMSTNKDARNDKNIIIISAGVSFFIALIINVNLAKNVFTGVRYSSPQFIALLPAVILLLGGYIRDRSRASVQEPPGILVYSRVLIFLLIFALSFVLTPGWIKRLEKMSEHRSILPYAVSEIFIQYNSKILTEQAREKVLQMQLKTEPDTTILAWFDASFYLDFTRNRILSLAGSEQVNPTVNRETRFAGGADWLRDYLKSFGVRYVLWSYKGVKKENAGSYEGLKSTFEDLANKSKVVYNDGARVIFDIDEG